MVYGAFSGKVSKGFWWCVSEYVHWGTNFWIALGYGFDDPGIYWFRAVTLGLYMFMSEMFEGIRKFVEVIEMLYLSIASI